MRMIRQDLLRRPVVRRSARLAAGRIRQISTIPPTNEWNRVVGYLHGSSRADLEVLFWIFTDRGVFHARVPFAQAARAGFDDDFGGPQHRGPADMPRDVWPTIARWAQGNATRALNPADPADASAAIQRTKRGNRRGRRRAFLTGAAAGAVVTFILCRPARS